MSRYRVEWFAPQYPPAVKFVDLLFFTSEHGFTADDASAVAELPIDGEVCFDNWTVRVMRVAPDTRGRWS